MILFAAVLVYIPAITSEFIWDDVLILTGNQHIKAADGLLTFWLRPDTVEYLPMTFTTLWVEWRLWGMNPIGYNVTDILLHATGALLFWRVLRRLEIPGAWLAGLVFAVHPVNVESVAWISERKNTLSLVFYLMALLWYLRPDQPNQRPWTNKWYWFSFFAFLLALLSKASVAMLPMALLGCVWWQHRRFTLQDMCRSLPFFAMSLAFGLLAVHQQSSSYAHGPTAESELFLERMTGGGMAVWFYLYKAIWPVTLCIVYPRWNIDLHFWASYLPGLLWLSGLVLCWKYRHTWGRACLFGLGYFTVTLFPVLGFFRMVFSYYSRVADRFQYLAIMGLIALIIGTATYWWNRRDIPGRRVCASVLVIVLSFLTWTRALHYENEEKLWTETLKQNPHAWVAHNKLGDVRVTQGKYQESISHYVAALELRPDHVQTHNNLGNILSHLGRTDEAIAHFQAALKNRPHFLVAHNNLGFQLVKLGKYDEAMIHFQEVLRSHPDSAEAHFGAGHVLFFQENLTEALIQYEASVRLKPGWPEARYNAGLVAGMIGNRSNAIYHLKEAVRIKPDYGDAAKTLAELEKLQ